MTTNYNHSEQLTHFSEALTDRAVLATTEALKQAARKDYEATITTRVEKALNDTKDLLALEFLNHTQTVITETVQGFYRHSAEIQAQNIPTTSGDSDLMAMLDNLQLPGSFDEEVKRIADANGTLSLPAEVEDLYSEDHFA